MIAHLKNQTDLFQFKSYRADKPVNRVIKSIADNKRIIDKEQKREWIGQNLYIKPSYIVSLPEFIGKSNFQSFEQIANQENLLDNKTKGVLSFKAITKLKNSVNWLICSAEEKKVFNKKMNSYFNFKVGFLTLTLPDTADKIDSKIFQNKLLNPFLTYCRSYLGLKNYVWKLEFQKNGKLHIHITIDVFIHHEKILYHWNKILRDNGFINEYQKKYSGCSFEKYLKMCSKNDTRVQEQKQKAWEKGTACNWSNPNTTDIHSVRKVRDLAAYICKYMAKTMGEVKDFKGRIWGCNQEISKANSTCLFVPSTECGESLKPLMNKNIQYKEITNNAVFPATPMKFGELFLLKYSNWQNEITGCIKEKFEETILYLRNIAAPKNLIYEV